MVHFNSGDEPDEMPMESEATFTNLLVTTSTSLIQWPSPVDSIPIAEFNSVEILQRSELKSYKDDHITKSDLLANGTLRRSLVSDAHANEMKFKTHMEDFRLAVEEFLNHRAALLSSRGVLGVEQFMNSQSVSRRLPSLPQAETWQSKMKVYSLALITSELNWLKNTRMPISRAYLVIPHTKAIGVVVEKINGQDHVNYAGIMNQISPQCSKFRQEILDFYENIDFFVMNNLAKLNDVGGLLLILIDSMKDLEKDLKNTAKVDLFMSKLIPFIERIPKVGQLAKLFYTAFHMTITQTKPVTTGLEKMNKKIEDLKIKKKLTTILNVTKDIALKINQARVVLSTSGHALILADAYCSSSTTQNLCEDVGGFISPVNIELNALRQEVVSFVSDLKGGLYEIASTAESAITGKIYQESMSLMSSAAGMFDTLDNALDKQIGGCVTNPVCGYKSEQKCATVTWTYYQVIYCQRWGVSYPCGSTKKTGSKKACVTVSLPYSCPVCVSFTVNQIVNGVVSISSLLTKTIENALHSFLNSLGIKFDMFKLPGMPGANLLNSVTSSITDTFTSLSFDPNMPALNHLKALVQAVNDKLDINKPTFPKCQ